MKTYYGRLAAALVAGWFVFALSASARGLFENDSNSVGLAVAFAALTPIVLFSVWFAASARFRQYTFSLNPRILTFAQSWRILGLVFIILEAKGTLPATFALPAGYGDMAIGATAVLAGTKLADAHHRGSFILWQTLGLLDLLVAVSLGTTARLIEPDGASMYVMTVLPLSLVPTFLVPLFVILHVICIAQARTWIASSNRNRPSAEPERLRTI